MEVRIKSDINNIDFTVQIKDNTPQFELMYFINRAIDKYITDHNIKPDFLESYTATCDGKPITALNKFFNVEHLSDRNKPYLILNNRNSHILTPYFKSKNPITSFESAIQDAIDNHYFDPQPTTVYTFYFEGYCQDFELTPSTDPEHPGYIPVSKSKPRLVNWEEFFKDYADQIGEPSELEQKEIEQYRQEVLKTGLPTYTDVSSEETIIDNDIADNEAITPPDTETIVSVNSEATTPIDFGIDYIDSVVTDESSTETENGSKESVFSKIKKRLSRTHREQTGGDNTEETTEDKGGAFSQFIDRFKTKRKDNSAESEDEDTITEAPTSHPTDWEPSPFTKSLTISVKITQPDQPINTINLTIPDEITDAWEKCDESESSFEVFKNKVIEWFKNEGIAQLREKQPELTNANLSLYVNAKYSNERQDKGTAFFEEFSLVDGELHKTKEEPIEEDPSKQKREFTITIDGFQMPLQLPKGLGEGKPSKEYIEEVIEYFSNYCNMCYSNETYFKGKKFELSITIDDKQVAYANFLNGVLNTQNFSKTNPTHETDDFMI